MSYIEELRRQKEEADRLLQQRQEASQEARLTSIRLLDEERARIKAEKEAVIDFFYKQSEFPRLIEEFPDLIRYDTRTTGRSFGEYRSSFTNAYAVDQTIRISSGGSRSDFHSYRSPIYVEELGPLSVFRFQVWALAVPIPQSRLQRLFPPAVQETPYRGFIIEATPEGDIITHGDRRHLLPLEQWRGNPAVQEQALEQVYRNPFVVEHIYSKYKQRDWEATPSQEG